MFDALLKELLKVIREIKRIRWIGKSELFRMVIVVLVVSIISAFILYFENLIAGLIFKILKFFFK